MFKRMLKTLAVVAAFSGSVLSAETVTIEQNEFYKEEGLVYYTKTDEPFTGIIVYRFAESGNKESERSYASGRLNGLYNSWYYDGTPAKAVIYVDGQMHGPFYSWYRNGQKEFEGEYIKGKQNGTWKRWNKNGGLISEKSYDANKPKALGLRPPKPPQ